MKLKESTTYIYYINKEDIVAYVNEEWNTFALENEGAHLINQTLGKPIWNFISDGLVKRLYQELFKAVRNAQRSVNVSFRCDSPEKMRFMQMELHPLENNGLAIHNKLLKEKTKKEGYSPEIISLIAQKGFPMCSRCNRILVEGNWHELTDALKSGLIVGRSLKAHYGMCEDCSSDIRFTIRKLQDRLNK